MHIQTSSQACSNNFLVIGSFRAKERYILFLVLVAIDFNELETYNNDRLSSPSCIIYTAIPYESNSCLCPCPKYYIFTTTRSLSRNSCIKKKDGLSDGQIFKQKNGHKRRESMCLIVTYQPNK